MRLSTVGLAAAASLIAGTVAALAEISGAAPADPTAKVVDAAGHLRVPADYRTLYQALGSGAIAADSGQSSKEMHAVYAAPGGDRCLPEDGALPGRHRSGERGPRDLDERDDHRHSKLYRQAEGLVRHGERQQGNLSGNPLWGDGRGWSWFDADKPLKTSSTERPYRLPGLSRAGQGHRLDLRERISRPASLGGLTLRSSPSRRGFAEAIVRRAGRSKGLL